MPAIDRSLSLIATHVRFCIENVGFCRAKKMGVVEPTSVQVRFVLLNDEFWYLK